MLGKATCRCALGFTGEDCQHSTTHPCFVSQPCLNGGTCHVLSRDTYECTCQVGFTGNQWDSGPHFPILSRYFHLVSFTIIWFFRVPLYSTCLSLWEGTGMFQSTIPNFLLKGEKEKAKGSNTPQWLTEVHMSGLGITVTALSLGEKLLVLLGTSFLKTPLPRRSGHWLFWFLNWLFLLLLRCLVLVLMHLIFVLWNSFLSPLSSHMTAFPRESCSLQFLQLSSSSSPADDSHDHPFCFTLTLTFRLVFLTICCILSLEIQQVPETQHVDTDSDTSVPSKYPKLETPSHLSVPHVDSGMHFNLSYFSPVYSPPFPLLLCSWHSCPFSPGLLQLFPNWFPHLYFLPILFTCHIATSLIIHANLLTNLPACHA